MHPDPSSAREGDALVPILVVALLAVSSAVYLVAARFPDPLPTGPAPDRARAESLAQAGLDHACGILLRMAREGRFHAGAWDAVLAAGGVVPQLGTETRVEALSDVPAMPGRMAYRVRVRDNDDDADPACDADLTVWISSVGVYVPPGPVGEEVVAVAETSLQVALRHAVANDGEETVRLARR